MFDFSPINISDRVDDTPPIPSLPTHPKSRAVSQTDWSFSSQPLSKRPLLETTSQTTKTNSITRPLATPSPSRIISTPIIASLPKRSASRLTTPIVPRTDVQATPTRVVRKFPGPAGCLPPLVSYYYHIAGNFGGTKIIIIPLIIIIHHRTVSKD